MTIWKLKVYSPSVVRSRRVVKCTKSLLQTHSLSCMVGGVKIQMQRASAFKARCVTTPSTAGGFVEISVSSNDQEYFTAGVRFEYQSVVHLTSVVPSFGRLMGNTMVMVTGSEFVDSKSLTCQFGVIRRSVHRFLFSQQLECLSQSFRYWGCERSSGQQCNQLCVQPYSIWISSCSWGSLPRAQLWYPQAQYSS